MTASISIDYAYSEKWKAAMDIKIHTLSTNEKWELTPLPQDRKETKGRWVFTINKERNLAECNIKPDMLPKDTHMFME